MLSEKETWEEWFFLTFLEDQMKSIHIDIGLKVCGFSKRFVGISTPQDQSLQRFLD